MGAMQVSQPCATAEHAARISVPFPFLQLIADDWVEPTYDSVANFTFQPASPFRNDTTDGFFQTFRIGVGHTSHVTRHTSHVTRHTSHVTRHTSHVTRHTSHIIRHTLLVTRYSSHATG